MRSRLLARQLSACLWSSCWKQPQSAAYEPLAASSSCCAWQLQSISGLCWQSPCSTSQHQCSMYSTSQNNSVTTQQPGLDAERPPRLPWTPTRLLDKRKVYAKRMRHMITVSGTPQLCLANETHLSLLPLPASLIGILHNCFNGHRPVTVLCDCLQSLLNLHMMPTYPDYVASVRQPTLITMLAYQLQTCWAVMRCRDGCLYLCVAVCFSIACTYI